MFVGNVPITHNDTHLTLSDFGNYYSLVIVRRPERIPRLSGAGSIWDQSVLQRVINHLAFEQSGLHLCFMDIGDRNLQQIVVEQNHIG